ncbi:phosphoadenylyl-sulfate reductase [Gracilibacillus boraciitolerans JCM 21714]|uniref:Adenosine 5'-phosphosulfate reductase n=1 Tax=Gracilibacillus boraciitolerans JCM 21714 TaxID=1298598 RepID=W4VGX6_9BACI|nr:phosphoadenylyl-sulfate reductase [Gracilibacillus boraciitolerans]GAE92078.1 phosphoadenylyl-sulfate reductase [Gracilibacillus boraciitolerans JCM 21714]
MLTYNNYKESPLNEEITESYDTTKGGALSIIEWAYQQYDESLVYACSFGAESMVIIDLIAKVKPNATLVFLDTELHFQETYDLIEEVKQRYPSLHIIMKKPAISVDEQREQYGSALWKRNPDQCCYIRKVKPLEEALGGGATAWISGLRREQSPTRAKTNFVNKDDRFHSIKICPLIYWTHEDVWNYIETNQLPYNKLHDENYPSIGCIPCTSKVLDNSDERTGRWSGFNKTECGLHVNP